MERSEGAGAAWSVPLGRRLATLLRGTYGMKPESIRYVLAPYRVCPLGAHVDHQLGLVTGMALDRGVLLAFVPNRAGRVRVRSTDYPGLVEFALTGVPPKESGDWGNYVRGAVRALQEQFQLRVGIDAVIGGSLPVGGLSSSAAVTCAYLLALEQVNGLEVTESTNIALSQRVENGYLGLQSGILDQSMILYGRRNRLLHLDCLTREVEAVAPGPLLPEYDVLVAYSGITEVLVGTDYNRRVDECCEAARRLLQLAGEPVPVRAVLRQVPPEVFRRYRHKLPETLRRRATHFFTECRRVTRGVSAWRHGDLPAFGRLMRESGRSSVESYECGSPELTTLYRLLCQGEGVYGARFSGAGFRGSCVALSDPAQRRQLTKMLTEGYSAAHPQPARRFQIHFCTSADGARIVPLPG